MLAKRWPGIVLAIGWLGVLIVGAGLAGAQDGTPCGESALERGMTVIIVPAEGVVVRAAAAGEAVDVLPGGSVHTVSGWPVCRAGLLWWQVQYVREDAWAQGGPTRQERIGWVAERAPNGDPLLLSLEAFQLTHAPTATPSPTPTVTPSRTSTATWTPSITPTASFTSTGTITPSPTRTPGPVTPGPSPTLDPTIWSQPFTIWRG